MSNLGSAQSTVVVTDRRHLFVPTGAIWMGILALTLDVALASTFWLHWDKVTYAERKTSLGTLPEYELPRIEFIVRDATSTGTIDLIKVAQAPILALTSLGVLLSLIALIFPRRNWLYIGLGFALNLAAFVALLPIPK
jgi:hypothetical protein